MGGEDYRNTELTFDLVSLFGMFWWESGTHNYPFLERDEVHMPLAMSLTCYAVGARLSK